MGHLPPDFYCEDKTTFDLLLADPVSEKATVQAGAPDSMPHGIYV